MNDNMTELTCHLLNRAIQTRYREYKWHAGQKHEKRMINEFFKTQGYERVRDDNGNVRIVKIENEINVTETS